MKCIISLWIFMDTLLYNIKNIYLKQKSDSYVNLLLLVIGRVYVITIYLLTLYYLYI